MPEYYQCIRLFVGGNAGVHYCGESQANRGLNGKYSFWARSFLHASNVVCPYVRYYNQLSKGQLFIVAIVFRRFSESRKK